MQTIYAKRNEHDGRILNHVQKKAIKEIDQEIRTRRKCRMKRDHGIGNWWKKRGKQCTDEYESISTRVKDCLKSPKQCEYHSLIMDYNKFAEGHELENGNERTSAKPLESSASASISRSPSSPSSIKSIPRPPPTIDEILDEFTEDHKLENGNKRISAKSLETSASASISKSQSSPSSPKSIPRLPPTIGDILDELRKTEPDIKKMNEYVNTCENPNDLYKILAKINRKIKSETALIQTLLPRDISSLNKRENQEYLTKKTELLTKLEIYKDFVSIKIGSRNRTSKAQGGREQGKQKTRKTKKRGTRRKTIR